MNWQAALSWLSCQCSKPMAPFPASSTTAFRREPSTIGGVIAAPPVPMPPVPEAPEPEAPEPKRVPLPPVLDVVVGWPPVPVLPRSRVTGEQPRKAATRPAAVQREVSSASGSFAFLANVQGRSKDSRRQPRRQHSRPAGGAGFDAPPPTFLGLPAFSVATLSAQSPRACRFRRARAEGLQSARQNRLAPALYGGGHGHLTPAVVDPEPLPNACVPGGTAPASPWRHLTPAIVRALGVATTLFLIAGAASLGALTWRLAAAAPVRDPVQDGASQVQIAAAPLIGAAEGGSRSRAARRVAALLRPRHGRERRARERRVVTSPTGVTPIGPAWFKAAEDRPGTHVEGWSLVAWTLGILVTALFALWVYWNTLQAIRLNGWRLDWFTVWALGCVAALAVTPQVYGDARFRCGLWPLILLIWAWNERGAEACEPALTSRTAGSSS